MTEILARIMELHNDPKLAFSTTPLEDEDLTVPILGTFVEEDVDGWFIRNPKGGYIAYSAKHSNSMPDKDGIDNMRSVLTELWVRYTAKNFNPQIDEGFRC